MYSYYRTIEVKSSVIGAAESNFPVVLEMTNSDFATAANGGEIQNTVATGGITGSLTVPADFMICSDDTDPLNTTLSFEFADYDASTGQVLLYVLLDSVSASANTPIHIYYNDTSVTTSQEDINNVWPTGYISVWHLDSHFLDSAANGNDLENQGMADTTAQIDGGKDSTANNKRMYAANDTSLDVTQLTYSFWLYPEGISSYGSVIRKNSAYIIKMFSGSDWELQWGDTAAQLADSVWSHVVITVDASSNAAIYVNGSQIATGTYAIKTSTNPLYFGAKHDQYYGLTGAFDEIRLISQAEDADWVSSQYENQSSYSENGTFWTALSTQYLPDETLVTLTWTDLSENETGFSIEVSETGATSGFSETGTVAADVTTYSDGFGTGTYWFRVKTLNSPLGNSEYSNVVEIEVP